MLSALFALSSKVAVRGGMCHICAFLCLEIRNADKTFSGTEVQSFEQQDVPKHH